MCPIAHFASSSGSFKCEPCNAGRYGTEYGRPNCTKCGLGKYQNRLNATSCKLCPIGYYTRCLGSDECNKCKKRTTTLQEGSTVCVVDIRRTEPPVIDVDNSFMHAGRNLTVGDSVIYDALGRALGGRHSLPSKLAKLGLTVPRQVDRDRTYGKIVNVYHQPEDEDFDYFFSGAPFHYVPRELWNFWHQAVMMIASNSCARHQLHALIITKLLSPFQRITMMHRSQAKNQSKANSSSHELVFNSSAAHGNSTLNQTETLTVMALRRHLSHEADGHEYCINWNISLRSK